MGTGSSPGGSKHIAVSSVTVQNGRTLTLSSPLVYDKKDKALSQQARQAVDVFEQNKKQAAVENVLFTDANGKTVYTNTGGRNSVSHPAMIEAQATVMTHNHPRPGKYENVLGGTFSPEDIDVLGRWYSNVKTIRASAAEGTYSMSIPPTVRHRTMRTMVADYRQYVNSIQGKYAAINNAKYADYMNGLCRYRDYKSQCNHSMNDMLIDLHNWLRNNRKKYGYNYTLEQ